jgi:C-terminal processing protease CtpA/Prc
VIHQQGITPDIFVPMSDEDEAALIIQRTPGGIESLNDADRAHVEAVRDGQLDRAKDLLKGILLYDTLGAQPKPGKMAAK